MTTDGQTAIQSSAARSVLRWGLPGLWTIAALLKLQPRMFTPELFINVLGPTAVDGQPPWVFRLLMWFDRLWVHHMAAADLTVFLIEAAIAALVWFGPERRTGRLGLILLIAWCALVWVFGEGFGSILTQGASVLSEAPGSAVFLASAALLLLLPRATWSSGRPIAWLRLAIGAFWLGGAVLQSAPFLWTGPGIAGVFGDVTMNGTQPPFMAFLTNIMVTTTLTHPAVWNALFVAAMLALGVLFLRPAGVWRYRLVLPWLAFMWALPQAFGNLWTGTATDLGGAVALGLLILASAAGDSSVLAHGNAGSEERTRRRPVLGGG